MPEFSACTWADRVVRPYKENSRSCVGAGLPDGPPTKTTVPTDTAGVCGRLIAAPTAKTANRAQGPASPMAQNDFGIRCSKIVPVQNPPSMLKICPSRSNYQSDWDVCERRRWRIQRAIRSGRIKAIGECALHTMTEPLIQQSGRPVPAGGLLVRRACRP